MEDMAKKNKKRAAPALEAWEIERAHETAECLAQSSMDDEVSSCHYVSLYAGEFLAEARTFYLEVSRKLDELRGI